MAAIVRAVDTVRVYRVEFTDITEEGVEEGAEEGPEGWAMEGWFIFMAQAWREESRIETMELKNGTGKQFLLLSRRDVESFAKARKRRGRRERRRGRGGGEG